MFRVFLKKRLSPPKEAAQTETKTSLPGLGANRRRYDRFDMDHKYITILNDSDILTVRDLSLKGFSADVSPRFFANLTKSDLFEARIRYGGEMYDVTIQVAWKSGSKVGFEMVEINTETQLFLRRILKAADIGNRFERLADEAAGDLTTTSTPMEWRKVTFFGPVDCGLYVWMEPESDQLLAWQLTTPDLLVEWSDSAGIITGVMTNDFGAVRSASGSGTTAGIILRSDRMPDTTKKSFAFDVLMALRDPLRDPLIETFSRPSEEA